jgi:hypothetical protein
VARCFAVPQVRYHCASRATPLKRRFVGRLKLNRRRGKKWGNLPKGETCVKVTEYIVDIYHAGTPWVSFTSDTPFQSICAGDYISPAFTYNQNPGEPEFESSGSGLRVTKVEHSIISRDGQIISHKLTVFTEEAENPWG